MNYYSARQRWSDKRWEFTYKNDAIVTAVGYCVGWLDYGKSDAVKVFGKEIYEKYNMNRRKFHDGGHETAEEAQECYRQYLIDFTMYIHNPSNPQMLHRCEICQKYTGGAIEINVSFLKYLCDEHRTRETAEVLFPAITEIWSSY